jgi:hypothetical protein
MECIGPVSFQVLLHTYKGAVFSLIDLGSVIPSQVSKFMIEISLQFEGSGRPHKMVGLCGN